MKALVGAFNLEKALIGVFFVIVQFRRLIVCSTTQNHHQPPSIILRRQGGWGGDTLYSGVLTVDCSGVYKRLHFTTPLNNSIKLCLDCGNKGIPLQTETFISFFSFPDVLYNPLTCLYIVVLFVFCLFSVYVKIYMIKTTAGNYFFTNPPFCMKIVTFPDVDCHFYMKKNIFVASRSDNLSAL